MYTTTLTGQEFLDYLTGNYVLNNTFAFPKQTKISNRFWEETDLGFKLEIGIAGLSKENLKVTIKNDVLNIATVGENKYNKEIDYTFTLPEGINKKGITVDVLNGVLEIYAPKSDEDYFELEIK